MAENGKRWLTIEQLVEILPYKRSTIYYLVHVRAISFVKKRGRLFFEFGEIQRWMEEGNSNGNGDRVSD